LQNALTYLTARISGQPPATPPPGLILAE
jgi:hypothetical protein